MQVDIQKVTQTYQHPKKKEHVVLKDISFSISHGEFVIILGESGCGKTTLLNLIAGLDKPSQGQILINGKKIEGIHPSRSMLFQQPALLPWLTVQDNVEYGCKLRKETKNLRYRVDQFLEVMGLSAYTRAYPAELSLGMAHRVCLARALVGKPELLLLDEPFAALDTFTRAHIQEELINLWLSEQFSAVFVTHDIDEAILLGNTIILLAGSPSGIIEVFNINLPYPRQPGDPVFKGIRQKIREKFKISYMMKRSLDVHNI